MSKKRTRDMDWDDDSGVDFVQPEVEVAKVSLRDFVVEQKVSAFVEAYMPADELDPMAEQLGDAELRSLFKATVCPLGDTLKLYMDDLALAGFKMKVSMATGEPCLFVKPKR